MKTMTIGQARKKIEALKQDKRDLKIKHEQLVVAHDAMRESIKGFAKLVTDVANDEDALAKEGF